MKQLVVGAKASFSKQVTASDVLAFAEMIGDKNPLHVDENYAKQTRFGARIAHGAFTFGLISAALGNELPGHGTVYMSQSVKFIKPVYFDDTITATVEIIAIRADKGIVTLKTDCANQHGDKIAEGEAVVFHPDAKSH
ncbi:3-hydroxybutyryl-CoA dehydratase [Anaerolineae bacterium]|nr:3-hydroxybutyryl-CoA dehydratase [Anaerolineae bacterium]